MAEDVVVFYLNILNDAIFRMVLCVCGAYIFSVYNLIISKVNLIYIDPSTVRVKSQQQSHKDQMNSVFAGAACTINFHFSGQIINFRCAPFYSLNSLSNSLKLIYV